MKTSAVGVSKAISISAWESSILLITCTKRENQILQLLILSLISVS
jgi:hypothetical protein